MTSWKHVAVTSVLTLTLCALSVPALAIANRACDKDAAKFCPGMQPGDGHYGPCLKKHSAKLSKECKELIAARERDLKQFQACVTDAEKLCPGVKPGGGRIMACLRTHRGDLSEACQNEISARTGQF